MTVLIAAAGNTGEAAEQTLQERDVIRVDSAEAALERVSDATVVVVGELAHGSPEAVRTEARTVGVPVVSLADHTTGSGVEVDTFRETVGLAERVFEYRDAVDDFYEQCRAAAEEGADVDLQAASKRAHTQFRELRDLAGYTPYEQVLGEPTLDPGRTGTDAAVNIDIDSDADTAADTNHDADIDTDHDADTDTDHDADTDTDTDHDANTDTDHDADDRRSNRDDVGRE